MLKRKNMEDNTDRRAHYSNFTVIVTHAFCTDGTFGALLLQHVYAEQYRKERSRIVPCTPSKIDQQLAEYLLKINQSTYDVIIEFVDICPSLEYLQKLIESGYAVSVYDHHVSNQSTIQYLKNMQDEDTKSNGFSEHDVHFDLNCCGTKLIWDKYYQFKHQSFGIHHHGVMSQLVNAIDDRDRWVWKHPGSKEITDYIYSHIPVLTPDMNQEDIDKVWVQILKVLDDGLNDIQERGALIGQVNASLVKQIIDKAQLRTLKIGETTYKVAMAQTVVLVSEVGAGLLEEFKEADFSMCWHFNKDSIYSLSLRSTTDRADVALIAKVWSGGGHRNASGCTVRDLFGLEVKY